MAAILLLFVIMASTPQTTDTATSSSSAISTNQESHPSPAIQSATKTHNVIFGVYVVVLILTVLGTVLVWKSGNKVQDAVKADADARIVEAKRGAAEADEKAAKAGENASKANERAQKLEGDNLTLRGQVATLETAASQAQKDVANLQKAASDAKAAQQRVETELERQKERTAIAERNLLELQERVKLRHLTAAQRKNLIDFLNTPATLAVARGPLRVERLVFDDAAQPFALEIKEAFDAAGWNSGDVGREMNAAGGAVAIGVVVVFHSAQAIPEHAGVVRGALRAAGLEPTLGENPNVPEGMVEILIGVKP